MGFFNKIKNFLNKKEDENPNEVVEKQKKLDEGLEKTKSSFF